MQYGDIEPHRKYLVEINKEDLRRRIKFYRLNIEIMDTISIACISETISSKFAIWREFLHPLDPISLDDFKNWFGIPNRAARTKLGDLRAPEGEEGGANGLNAVDLKLLPRKTGFEFARLESPQRRSVAQMARNLLYTYVDPDDLKRPEIIAVVDYMIEQARRFRPEMFAIPNLVVCPGDNIKFENIAVLFFHNVVVYGNGKITTRGHTRIDTHHLQHVDA